MPSMLAKSIFTVPDLAAPCPFPLSLIYSAG